MVPITVGQSGAARAPDGGGGKSRTGVSAKAFFMYIDQISAGNDPPVTVRRPPVPDSETGRPLESSLAISTAVAKSGV
jgi:hypothetical protein